jgi:hypothetical protein
LRVSITLNVDEAAIDGLAAALEQALRKEGATLPCPAHP